MTSKKEYKFLQFRVLIDERDSHQERIEKEVQRYLDNGWELYNSHTSRGDTGRHLADVFIQILIRDKKNETLNRSDGTKRKGYSYYEDGNMENIITYQADGVTKYCEHSYHKNGNIKASIAYQIDGVAKWTKSTYYENGQLKNMTNYQADGMAIESEQTYDEFGKMKTDINETI